MKKIIAALLVLAVAAPALATNISVVQISGTEAKISYDASGDPCVVRAFNIDVVLDDPNLKITGGEGSADYWVSPGSFAWWSRARINNNTAKGGQYPPSGIADEDDHPDTQPGVDTNGVTLEQGSLYGAKDGWNITPPTQVPGRTGDLNILVIDVNLLSNPTTSPYLYIQDPNTVITMGDNAARGGILLQDGTTGSSYGTTQLWLSTLSRAQYAKWLAWGGGNPGAAPANWRTWCWLCGDVDADGFVTFADVIDTFDYFKDGTSAGEGDSDMDGFETFADVINSFDNFKDPNGCTLCVP